MTDSSVDPLITKSPQDYLAPVSGQVPWILIIGVYLIAFLLVISLMKNSY